MNMAQQDNTLPWRFGGLAYVVMAAAALLAIFIFRESLGYMVELWGTKEEYSYGYILPFISLFLLWQNRPALESAPIRGAWLGAALAVLGLALFFLGDLSTLYIVQQYAFLIVLAGMALALLGWRGFKPVWAAFALLIFMIPLPNFLYQGLSAQLQLMSSSLGVAVIRAFGISVALEGNVIDLGSMQLQVVEACSGLRYLFPLLTLGFLAAYFFRGAMWKRVVLFLSTIPITVIMNSLRIGMIGIMVEHWGRSMAEGFLHDFEGWAVFMGCTAFLVFEMWLLAKIGPDRRPLRDAFSLDMPGPSPKGQAARRHPLSKPFLVGVAALVAVGLLHTAVPKRAEIVPARTEFSAFPMAIGEWKGRTEVMDRIYIDALKFDDYVMADFVNDRQQSVNFYVAYYGSQRKGESAHSPRSCIPGGGWEITSLTQRVIPGATVAGRPIRVNRTVIQKGEEKQLVYYWFQQRGRVITNEYLVKWFLFWDALTRNRSDGALVRLTAYVKPGGDLEAADKQLVEFTQAVAPKLPAFIPE
jgi:exosortase D (VPLPA-CTERM-specific)